MDVNYTCGYVGPIFMGWDDCADPSYAKDTTEQRPGATTLQGGDVTTGGDSLTTRRQPTVPDTTPMQRTTPTMVFTTDGRRTTQTTGRTTGRTTGTAGRTTDRTTRGGRTTATDARTTDAATGRTTQTVTGRPTDRPTGRATTLATTTATRGRNTAIVTGRPVTTVVATGRPVPTSTTDAAVTRGPPQTTTRRKSRRNLFDDDEQDDDEEYMYDEHELVELDLEPRRLAGVGADFSWLDDSLECAIVDPCPNDALDDIDSDGLCADEDSCPFDPDNDVDGDGGCDGTCLSDQCFEQTCDEWIYSHGLTCNLLEDTFGCSCYGCSCKPMDCNGACKVKAWYADNICDDINNNCGCGWDGGDCCGPVNAMSGGKNDFTYCNDCTCRDPSSAFEAKDCPGTKTCDVYGYIADFFCDDGVRVCGCVRACVDVPGHTASLHLALPPSPLPHLSCLGGSFQLVPS